MMIERESRSNKQQVRIRATQLGVVFCGVSLLLGLATGCQNGQEDSGQETGGLNKGAGEESGLTAPSSSDGKQVTPPQTSLDGSSDSSQDGGQEPMTLGQQGGGEGASVMAEFQKIQSRLKEIDAQIAKIREKVKENEELAQARKEFENAAIDKMEESSSSTNVEEDLAALKKLGKSIQESGEAGAKKGDMSQETKQDLQDYRKKEQELAKLQQKALKDPEVQQLREEYRDEMLGALKEADPKAEALLEERKKLIKQLQELQTKLMQQQMMKQKQQQMQQKGQSGGGTSQPATPPSPGSNP